MTVAIAVDASRTDVRDVPARLEFVAPILGMEGLRSFHLDSIDDHGYVCTLRSEDDAEVRLFVLSPRAYFPSYAPQLSDEARDSLGLDPAADPLLLAVIHPGADEATTVNLLAPIVVNAAAGTAAQVVLDGDEWPLRATLGDASSDGPDRGGDAA